LKSPVCKSPAINYRSIEKFLVESIFSPHWTSLRMPSATPPTNLELINAIKVQIEELKSNNSVYTDAMVNGGNTQTLVVKIRENDAKIESLSVEIETLKTNEAQRQVQLSPSEAFLMSRLFRYEKQNVEKRRKLQSIISNQVESIYCCKNSKNEIGVIVLMRSKNLLLASVNVQSFERNFVIALEPWQLHPESRRVAIYYEFIRDRESELIPEPRLFKMKKGFSPVSEFMSAKAFDNLKKWGVISGSNGFQARKNADEMEKFRVLKDAFSSYFPMYTFEKFDGSPIVGVFGESKNLRSLEEAQQVLVNDFFDRRI